MKKIRVLHIIPMLGPGGAERVAVEIVKGLNPQRFEPALVSIWRRVGCDLELLLEESHIPAWYLGKDWGFDGRTYQRLHHILRAYRADVVHTHLHVLRYALPSLFVLKPEALLHTVHNLAEREIEPRARFLQNYALRHGVIPVAVSDEVALSLQHLYGIEKCQVIANGIPTNNFACPRVTRKEWRAREGFHDAQILFVCVARFAAQKNHALLLKAFARGPASDPKAHLVLVGEGDLQPALKEQAQNLGLGGQIHFLGLRTDISDLLGAMDIFVLSSDWEGNPLSVMEAMASGLPIVSTAAGGVQQLFTDGREGFMVRPGDAEGLANSMAVLLRSPETTRLMGRAAAQRAREKFDVSEMVRAYERLYEKVIDQPYRFKMQSFFYPPNMSLREA